jgi:Uma2 family endonuclease
MRVRESRRVRWISERQRVGVGDAPLSVSDYLRLCREDDEYELLDGVLVQRIAAQLPHEWLFQWMLRLVGGYAEARGLGVVLGSRTPVQITPYRVRLPDLLFVRTERMPILNPQALLEPPDWVMEIRLAGERASDWVRLESDYRTIGVPEIWMVDLPASACAPCACRRATTRSKRSVRGYCSQRRLRASPCASKTCSPKRAPK